MKGKVLQFVLLTFIIYKMQCDQEFSSTRSARCRKGDQDLYLNGFTWTKCLKACNDRTPCQGVSYRRSVHQCVLNYDISNTSPLDVCPGFMYAEKPFWNYVDKYERTECSCKGFQVCSEDGTDDMCTVKECPRHTTLPDGRIHGNMFAIGSKLKVSCNAGFTLVGADQYICNEDGQWVNVTGHIPSMPVCDVCPAGWTRIGGSCFVKIAERTDLALCKAECEAIGGKVLTIGSDEEKAVVQTFVESITGTSDLFWLGVVANTSDVAGRPWYTIDSGSVVTFFDWNPGEPNGHLLTPREYCAVTGSSIQLRWHDFPCAYMCTCICQM